MLAIYTFMPIFAPAIRLLLPLANGLVAQLNSALDYGSREVTESSQLSQNPNICWGFFMFIISDAPILKGRRK
jgi:hypothetical protein